MRAYGIVISAVGLAAACGRGESAVAGASSYATAYGRLADSVLRLPSGDSVEFQATGPAVVPGQPTGALVTYYPFGAGDDTLRLRAVALEFFRALRPRLRGAPPFVVMRAVDVRAADRQRVGTYTMHNFGVVIEHRGDGRWYVLGEAAPVPGT